jgi:four helix bundle protein
LKKTKAGSVIKYQLIKSATSTGANYRALCKARSKVEFISKAYIVLEESDESEYWLGIIEETDLSENKPEVQRLKKSR